MGAGDLEEGGGVVDVLDEGGGAGADPIRKRLVGERDQGVGAAAVARLGVGGKRRRVLRRPACALWALVGQRRHRAEHGVGVVCSHTGGLEPRTDAYRPRYADVVAEVDSIESDLAALEAEALFFGEYDDRPAILSVHAGAGGVDAADWAAMLLRMYLRFLERRGFEVEVDEVSEAEKAGIRSATLTVRGERPYGTLEGERGVHRLVRISPFDAAKRRHTSFAGVDVIPEVEAGAVEIDPEDLRIDTFRSSGAGGQHVNVTDSAVRITHLPTGIVVSCQNERSQHKNKAMAMKVLRARLYERARQEQEQELERLGGEKKEIAWGSQIRSYVLAPYQLVKDHRTGVETGNVEAVLDGRIDPFIEAYLFQGQRKPEATSKK